MINTKSLNDFECRCHFCNNVLKLNQKSERKNSVKPTRITGLIFFVYFNLFVLDVACVSKNYLKNREVFVRFWILLILLILLVIVLVLFRICH